MADRALKKNRKKLLREANDLLRLATKIYHYKKDILAKDEKQLLVQLITQLKEKTHQSPLENKTVQGVMSDLKSLLEKVGKTFYPQTMWSENVEMFLVAALLAIGIRMFFLQPFKIPTNSMYPTYYGMTYEVYTEKNPYPPFFERALDKLQLGGQSYVLRAPSAGHIFLPLKFQKKDHYDFVTLEYEKVRGRKWIIFPTRQLQYTFFIGEAFLPISVKLPAEFAGFNALLKEALSPDSSEWTQAGSVVEHNGKPYLRLDRKVEKGETVLAFQILTGDTLFVDRFSYHFFKPQRGDAFVFRTDEIPEIQRFSGNEGKYYIKRIAGVPKETLEIRDKTLYVNGTPATGAKAFVQNAKQQKNYKGYMAAGNLREGKQVYLPPDSFYALGDNSGQSLDSRSWGAVPKKTIIGKAAFIFYPFSNRWGQAQ